MQAKYIFATINKFVHVPRTVYTTLTIICSFVAADADADEIGPARSL